LNLVDAREVIDRDPTTTRLTPSALTAQDDGWRLAGQLSRTGEEAGALGVTLRIANDLSTGAAAAYACPERLSFYPSAAIPSTAGSVTLVGDAAGLGFVARVKPNDALGFVRFPNLGGGMKVFARDGSLPDDSLVSNTPVDVDASDLTVEPRDFEITTRALNKRSQEFTGTARTEAAQ